MWIRSAFWVGAPRPGLEARFEQAIEQELLPALEACPGVRDVKALWPRKREESPPEIACQLLLMFDKEEDIALMLASPERAAMRARVPAIAALFDGAVSHVNYDVR